MRDKEIVGLWESYLQVCENKQLQLDEGIGSSIKSLFGKKKKPEAPKPESRGAELRRRYNTGPEGSETSPKRKILDKTRERAESDKKKYGDSPYTQSVAADSAAAHEKYLKAGYSKYGADRPDSGGKGGSGGSGRGRKAFNRAAALKKEDFMYMMEYLMTEGYVDTNESAMEIMVNMSEEWMEEILDEAYQKPKFGKKDYLKKLSKRGGMGMGTPEDPHGYRDPGMAKVGAEFSKRITAEMKAKKSGEPDTYRAEKESQSKNR